MECYSSNAGAIFFFFIEIPIVQMMATEEHDDGGDRSDSEANSTGGK